MRMLLPLSLLLLSACAAPRVPTADELRTETAVKDRYWRIQGAQQQAIPRTVTVVRPERIEDGALRVPTLIPLDYP